MQRENRQRRKPMKDVADAILLGGEGVSGPVSCFLSLAPSQCPRHSPASFIGGRVEEDEGKQSFYAPARVIGFPSPPWESVGR